MDLVDWIVKQTGKISDNFNKYKFYVKQQPEIIESSSVVVINTYNSRDMTATIPCSFRWFSIRNGVTTEAQQFKGNTYICEPADVGCMLQVQITSSDPQCPGTALMSYGPVKFDVLLKKEIQIALSTGQSNFYIDIGEGNQRQQCQLKVSQQRIAIQHIGSQATFMFNYNMIEPKFEVIYKVPTKVRIIFNPKYYDQLIKFLTKISSRQITLQQVSQNPFIQIAFNSRKAKDSFIFIAKAFNTKKLLQTTAYVSNLQKQLDFTKISQKNNKTFDYIEQISQLQRDIMKLLQINSKNFMQKRIYLQQNKKLQKQIQQIVSTYVRIIQQKFRGRQDFQQSFIILKQKQEEIKFNKAQKQNNAEIQARLLQLQMQNEHLKSQLNKVRNGNVQGKSDNYLHQVINYEPFKKKSVIHSIPIQGNIQSQEVIKINQTLKSQLDQLKQKYDLLQTQYQRLIHSNSNNQPQKQSSGKIQTQHNVDLFDAKSVKSLKDKNHNQSNFSYSSHVSKDTPLINTQKNNFIQQTPQRTPQFNNDSPYQFQNLQKRNKELKSEIKTLQQKIVTLTSQFQQKQQKYKKKISQLSDQLSMYRRNNDVLNRSQQLSMEMQEYNQQQQDLLKKDNQFLKKEVENYKELCQKYISDAKKYKQLKKQTQQNSSILQEAGI